MAKEEFLSIKDFAKRAGVSPQAIYQRLDKDLKPFLSTRNGKKVLSTRALDTQTVKENSTKSKPSNSSDFITDALLKQLEIKDKQIADLTEALRAEQETHAVTQKLYIAAATQLRQLEGVVMAQGDAEPQEEPQKPTQAQEEPKASEQPKSFKERWHSFWYN